MVRYISLSDLLSLANNVFEQGPGAEERSYNTGLHVLM